MAIAFVQSPAVGTGAATTATTGSATWTTGNTILISSAVSNGGIAVNTISTSGGTVRWFAVPSSIRNSSPGLETWVGFIDTGWTGTITHNLSGSTNSVICAAEYSGVGGIGVGNSSAPAATANPSISLTTSGADTWVVGCFAANDTTAYTAGTGNLRASGSLTNVGGALVDNPSDTIVGGTGTASVTHSSATWGIGIIELYDGGLNIGNGAYSFGGSGTNGYATGDYNNVQAGVSFTTGNNANGYTLNSASVFTNDAGTTGSLRTAIYTNAADPNKALVAQGGPAAFGIPAGTGTPNIHAIPLVATLAANTTYWVTWNNNLSTIAYRLDDTAFASGTLDRYILVTFGSAPSPWGTTTTELGGPHMWVHVTPIVAPPSARQRGLFIPLIAA